LDFVFQLTLIYIAIQAKPCFWIMYFGKPSYLEDPRTFMD
jgi:hypothetical protein